MTASFHHRHRSGACFQQGQQRCAVMSPVVSVWTKKTGTGNQN